MNYNTPEQLADLMIAAAKHKLHTSLFKVFLFGIMAGAFIAIGAEASSAASHTIESVGLAKTLSGVIFPVGLMMIVIVGGHLFTSSCMNLTACFDKQTKWTDFFLNIIVVYLGNFVGAWLIAVGIYYCGEMNYSDGALGGYTIKVAANKLTLDYSTAIVSGILCNILVCIAVIMSMAAKDIVGKLAAIFFPIFLFIISGFEHCVANMYYLPAGYFAAGNPNYVNKAETLYHVTAEQIANLDYSHIITLNLIPVTIGNAIGGSLFVGTLLYWVYKR